MSVPKVSRRLVILGTFAILTGCTSTDNATRLAHDIEAGAKQLSQSTERTLTIKHVPSAEPKGCSGPNSVQLVSGGSLLMWCTDAASLQVTASYSTNHHKQFVSVPQTFFLEMRPAGAPVYVDLEKSGDRIIVSGMR